MPDGREYELKFAIDTADVPRLLANPGLEAPTARQRLRSTYFDTADAALRARGVTLRVRRSGAALVQTVKRTGASIVDREEWEREGAGAAPDLDWLRSTPLRKLFGKKRVARHLQPRFTVDVERAVFTLARGEATIEGALDRGTIATPAGSLPVSEFELELKSGRPGAVLSLARDLVRDVPMVLSLASKSERGYGRGEPGWGHATKDLSLRLDADMRVADAFEAATQACLRLLLANTALIGGASDAEAVHKARIALRRLRAAFDLFGPVLRRRWRRTVLADVKWMARKLGAARDADVFLAQVEAGAEGKGAGDLIGLMRDAQEATRRSLRAALASPRWRLLLLDLLEGSRCAVRRRARRRRLPAYLDAWLEAGRRALAARSRGFAALSPEARHDVRKRAKTLRYACDFAGCGSGLVARRGALGRLVADLEMVQEALGTLHDRDALHERLRADVIRPGRAASTTAAAAELMMAGDAGSERALRAARHALRRIRRRARGRT